MANFFEKFKVKCSYRRYVALQCFTSLVLSYILRFCLSLAIVEMTTSPIANAKNRPVDHSSCPAPKSFLEAENRTQDKDFQWTESEKGLVNTAMFWGYITTQIPGGILADKWDAAKVVALGMMITSSMTVLTPITAKLGGWQGLIGLRVVLGASQGLVYAALHTLMGKWIPTSERGTWVSFVFSGVHIGNTLNMVLTGVFLGAIKNGWPIVFYLYGGIGVAWTVSFFFTVYGSPSKCPKLGEEEKALFEVDADKDKPVKKHKIPWKGILKNGPFWGNCFGMIGHDFGIFALVTQMPAFMKNILHFDISKNGILNGSIYLLIFSVSLVSGHIVDFVHKHKWVSLTRNRQIGTTIASVGPSVGLVLSVYVGCNSSIAAACLIGGQGFMGFFYSSLKLNPLDITKNHIGTVSGMITAAGNLSGVYGPYIISFLTPNQTLTEWRIVMWFVFAKMSVTNIIFWITASTEIQKFDYIGEEKDKPDVAPAKEEKKDRGSPSPSEK